ncbi:hypothetical protein PAXRUDRAFT_20270 [Paxillus rubicundulus Ve08.2h10]|uniref:Uncharacterized protein n=1 Tax=Paxillus rubicundulus Ve08.2h10 TaxID=930991 RepID=A0A0D0D2D4_9AGAM|nr:hypothetical protein PAXRUDRAFT_20270 [Paxillus rubicundulus Ve08.2h10]
MDIPSHWKIHMSNIIAEYMVNRFLETIGRPTRPTPALPDTSIPLSAVCEAVKMLIPLGCPELLEAEQTAEMRSGGAE